MIKDKTQEPVPLPNATTENQQLSFASRAYDRGNKGHLDDIEAMVRRYDTNGDGKIDMNEVYQIVKDVKEKEENRQSLQKYLKFSVVFGTVLIASIFGLTYSVVALTQEVHTNPSNELISSATGEIVTTNTKGYAIEFEPDPTAIINLAHRKLFGMPREVADSHELELVGSANLQEVRAGYEGIVGRRSPVQVSATHNGRRQTRSVRTNNLARESRADGKEIFSGIRLEDQDEPFFQVQCEPGRDSCKVYSVGPIHPDHSRSLWHSPDDEDSGCFSPETSVMTKSGRVVSMVDLQVGDEVLVHPHSNKFEAVYAIPHYHHSKATTFVHITTDNESSIELTGNHMIYLSGKENPLPASMVQVGHYVVDSQGKPTRVVAIKEVERNGLYAPLTASGAIVVSGLWASAYPSVQRSEHLEILGVTLVSQQQFTDMLVAPYRSVCTSVVFGHFCQNESRDKNGYTAWAKLGAAILGFWSEQNALVQGLVFIPVMALVLPLYMVSSAPGAMLVLAVNFLAWRHRKASKV